MAAGPEVVNSILETEPRSLERVSLEGGKGYGFVDHG